MPKIVITHDSLPIVVNIIRKWDKKLTWELLCNHVSEVFGIKDGVQRQSLSCYSEIQKAYTDRKNTLKKLNTQPDKKEPDVTFDYLKNQVAALQIEIERLQIQNENYKQRFVLWLYNAYKHGVRTEALDSVVSQIDHASLNELRNILEKPLSELKRSSGGR